MYLLINESFPKTPNPIPNPLFLFHDTRFVQSLFLYHKNVPLSMVGFYFPQIETLVGFPHVSIDCHQMTQWGLPSLCMAASQTVFTERPSCLFSSADLERKRHNKGEKKVKLLFTWISYGQYCSSETTQTQIKSSLLCQIFSSIFSSNTEENILKSIFTLTISARWSFPVAVVVKCWSKAKVEVEMLHTGAEGVLRGDPTAARSMVYLVCTA